MLDTKALELYHKSTNKRKGLKMATKEQAEYQETNIMPEAKKQGCKCEFSREQYERGNWRHKSGCPAPLVECLPNAPKLMAALRAGV